MDFDNFTQEQYRDIAKMLSQYNMTPNLLMYLRGKDGHIALPVYTEKLPMRIGASGYRAYALYRDGVEKGTKIESTMTCGFSLDDAVKRLHAKMTKMMTKAGAPV